MLDPWKYWNLRSRLKKNVSLENQKINTNKCNGLRNQEQRLTNRNFTKKGKLNLVQFRGILWSLDNRRNINVSDLVQCDKFYIYLLCRLGCRPYGSTSDSDEILPTLRHITFTNLHFLIINFRSDYHSPHRTTYSTVSPIGIHRIVDVTHKIYN